MKLLFQGACGDAATSWPSWKCHGADGYAAVDDWIAVAAHAPFVAVENGGVDDVGVLAPVPVGLVAFVRALFAEGGFIGPNVVTVPVHEVCGGMD
jgi:hypothetical protein